MVFEFDDFDVRDRFYSIDEKNQRLKLTLEVLSPQKQAYFRELCARAYVYHDSALDGVVISGEELAAVFSSDSSGTYMRSRVMQEIRNHRDVLREVYMHMAREKCEDRVYLAEVIKFEDVLQMHAMMYQNLPRKEPGVLRTVTPLHSAYFHIFADPIQIQGKLESLCHATEDEEFRSQHPINQAVLFHQEMMRILPFTEGSGKVARMLMNGFLLQGGYDYVIVHGSERQRYYETLREGPEAFRDLLLDSMETGLETQMKYAKEGDLSVSNSRVVMRSMSYGL